MRANGKVRNKKDLEDCIHTGGCQSDLLNYKLDLDLLTKTYHDGPHTLGSDRGADNLDRGIVAIDETEGCGNREGTSSCI